MAHVCRHRETPDIVASGSIRRSVMAGNGRIYKRGEIFFIAYSDHGREFRESTRSRNVEDAKRLLEQRLAACRPPTAVVAGVPFDDLTQR